MEMVFGKYHLLSKAPSWRGNLDKQSKQKELSEGGVGADEDKLRWHSSVYSEEECTNSPKGATRAFQ